MRIRRRPCGLTGDRRRGRRGRRGGDAPPRRSAGRPAGCSRPLDRSLLLRGRRRGARRVRHGRLVGGPLRAVVRVTTGRSSSPRSVAREQLEETVANSGRLSERVFLDLLRLVGCSALDGPPPRRTARVVFSTPRSASFTASSVGKASAISGSSSTMFTPSACRRLAPRACGGNTARGSRVPHCGASDVGRTARVRRGYRGPGAASAVRADLCRRKRS